MKKLIIPLIMALILPGLSLQAQEEAVVTPSPIRVIGDSLYFTVDVNLPAKNKMGTSGTLQIRPMLGDYKYDYFPATPMTITNASSNGIRTSIDVAMPFIEDMIGNELDIDILYTSSDGKDIKEEVDDIAECCNTIGSLFLNTGQFVMATTEHVQRGGKDPKKLLAQFNFPLDISTLDPAEYRKDIRAIGDFLKEYPNSNVTIRGFASPEGVYERNVYLSETRSERAAEWLQAQLREHGYSRYVNPDNFDVEVTHEDWIGFLRVLEENDRFNDHFEDVRSIVSSGMSPMDMELAVLEELGYTWEQRHAPELEELWKPLRRSIAVLETDTDVVPELTQEQRDSVVQAYLAGNLETWQMREILDQEEWLEVAQATYAETGEMSLLLGYYSVYPDDYRIINDLAILDLVTHEDLLASNHFAIIGGDDALIGVVPGDSDVKWKKDIEKDGKFKYKYGEKQEDGAEAEFDFVMKVEEWDGAIPMLELAYEMERDDWAVLSNLGAAYLTIGNFASAQHYLEESLRKKNTNEANYNLAIALANRNQFDEAIRYFDMAEASDFPGYYYNRGLAHLLSGNHSAAKADLQRHVQEYPDWALGHYVLAAVGAEMNDEALMTAHLQRAIQIRKILSDVSQEDLAFHNYFDTDVFEMASDDDPEDDEIIIQD